MIRLRRGGAFVRERGAAGVEFAAIVPTLLLAALIAFQLGLTGWTVVATGEAARSGARAESLGQDGHAAVRQALPGRLSAESINPSRGGNGVRYSVTVRIPSLIPGVHLPTVTRDAVMPTITTG